MTVAQAALRAGLLDAEVPAPEGLITPQGMPATRRFDVYRNNVVQSLIEAMRSGFPIIQKLLGTENFTGIAAAYVRAHPPRDPLMMRYGQAFPAFLVRLEALRHIGYLADVARLELALRASYHAADAAPLDPARLAGVPQADLPQLRLSFAPSAVLIRSRWPLYDIWRFNVDANAPKPEPRAQHVLVMRPDFDPLPHPLTPEAGAWVADLMDGAPLGTAGPEGFDPSAPLALVLGQGGLTDLTTKD